MFSTLLITTYLHLYVYIIISVENIELGLSFYQIQSDNLYLLIGTFSPFTFIVILMSLGLIII